MKTQTFPTQTKAGPRNPTPVEGGAVRGDAPSPADLETAICALERVCIAAGDSREDRWSAKRRGDAKGRQRAEKSRDSSFRKRGSRAKLEHVAQADRKTTVLKVARERRIAAGTEGISKAQRAFNSAEGFAVSRYPTLPWEGKRKKPVQAKVAAQVIRTELVRGGVEEDPGPSCEPGAEVIARRSCDGKGKMLYVCPICFQKLVNCWETKNHNMRGSHPGGKDEVAEEVTGAAPAKASNPDPAPAPSHQVTVADMAETPLSSSSHTPIAAPTAAALSDVEGMGLGKAEVTAPTRVPRFKVTRLGNTVKVVASSPSPAQPAAVLPVTVPPKSVADVSPATPAVPAVAAPAAAAQIAVPAAPAVAAPAAAAQIAVVALPSAPAAVVAPVPGVAAAVVPTQGVPRGSFEALAAQPAVARVDAPVVVGVPVHPLPDAGADPVGAVIAPEVPFGPHIDPFHVQYTRFAPAPGMLVALVQVLVLAWFWHVGPFVSWMGSCLSPVTLPRPTRPGAPEWGSVIPTRNRDDVPRPVERRGVLRGHVLSDADMEALFTRQTGCTVRSDQITVKDVVVKYTRDSRLAPDRNVKIIEEDMHVVQMEVGSGKLGRSIMPVIFFFGLISLDIWLKRPASVWSTLVTIFSIVDFVADHQGPLIFLGAGLRLLLVYWLQAGFGEQARGYFATKYHVFIGYCFTEVCALAASVAPADETGFDLRRFAIYFRLARRVLVMVGLIRYVVQYLRKPRKCVVAYIPHLVSAVLLEYTRGTSAEVVRNTLRQRCQRLACLPTPDLDAVRLNYGSELALEILIEQQDFFGEGVACVTRPC